MPSSAWAREKKGKRGIKVDRQRERHGHAGQTKSGRLPLPGWRRRWAIFLFVSAVASGEEYHVSLWAFVEMAMCLVTMRLGASAEDVRRRRTGRRISPAFELWARGNMRDGQLRQSKSQRPRSQVLAFSRLGEIARETLSLIR